jgi:hypothetical protein
MGLVEKGSPFLGKRKPWIGLSFLIKAFGWYQSYPLVKNSYS